MDVQDSEGDINAIKSRLGSLLVRLTAVENTLLELGTDIGSVKGSIARINAKLAVEVRKDNLNKPRSTIDEIIDDLLKNQKDVVLRHGTEQLRNTIGESGSAISDNPNTGERGNNSGTV